MAETPGQRLDRKIEEQGKAADKARQKAHDDELSIQEQIAKAVFAVTRDKDGDPKPIVPPEA
jgi:hypothetical protein